MTVVAGRGARLAGAALLLGSLGLALLLAVGPRTGAYRTLTVLSSSMQPTFGAGSVVVVRPVPVGDLEVGDVITYNVPVEDHRVITHRIIEIDHSGARPVVRTQGDASVAPDPWTLELTGETAWRAAASIPMLGYGIGALREPWVARGLVLAGPLALSLLLLRDLWRRPSPCPIDVIEPPREAVGGASRADGAIATLALAARTSRGLARWVDDVVSGRRWLRSTARHV